MYIEKNERYSISRTYQNVNSEENKKFWDYSSKKVTWGNVDDYSVGRVLGKGNFSTVYKGIHKSTKEHVTIKILEKDRADKIRREISVLRRLKGGRNVAHIFDVVKDYNVNKKCIVMHFYKNDNLITRNTTLDEREVKLYMYQLLNGLNEAHGKGVIHRDIKPSNIVINRKRMRLKIIDWGMADFYHPYKEYHLRVGSHYYKAPELLLGMKQYDYSLDMWSFACLFSGLICNSFPFFKGKEEPDLLRSISGFFGKYELLSYIEKYSLSEPCKENLEAIYNGSEESKMVLESSGSSFKSELALDLISKVMRVDHQERLTAKEAMEHPYFDEVRNI
ncbi:protein kinase domain-containing protein [Oceanimonas baumannii]|nr:protein kinase [Oceanimonas baumannii]TDW60284.1 casein kinase II subunit alpha [Oceanimonas baumannii]